MLNRTLPVFSRTTAALLLAAAALSLAACASDDKAKEPEPASAAPVEKGVTGDSTTTVAIEPGRAGGVIVETFNAKATVSAIDKATRKITLTGSDGSTGSFIAGPEVRNFDQLRVNDKVNASIRQEIVAFVRRGDDKPSTTAAAVTVGAAKGSKPGMISGSAAEIVARVWSIDQKTRNVDLVFDGGEHKVIAARPDVDLSRYRVGDSMVIQMRQALALVSSAP